MRRQDERVMTDLRDFVGTWRAERGFPFSTHTFTWEAADAGLRGEWTIEATVVKGRQSSALVRHWPKRLQMQISEPSLDEGRLLFYVNGGPVVTEFRLVDVDEAELGAAVDKLPPEFAGPEHHQSIEGHRVRLMKHSGITA